jgi:esterase
MGMMYRGTVAGDGLDLAYREWGKDGGGRLPLVLLHGLTGHGDDWGPVAARLAQHRRVIALDARGHGASEWSADAAYAGDAHFADVATALDALDVQRCALAGYSMGGGVAILTAGALPERVARLVVVDAYPAPEMTEGSRRIAEIVAGISGDLPAARSGSLDEYHPPRPSFDPAIALKIAEELAGGEARRLDLWPLWEAVCCPALVVRGALSDVLPASLAEEMLARQPYARLETVPRVGHQIPFGAPETLAGLIEAFLDGAD